MLDAPACMKVQSWSYPSETSPREEANSPNEGLTIPSYWKLSKRTNVQGCSSLHFCLTDTVAPKQLQRANKYRDPLGFVAAPKTHLQHHIIE
eukprot:1147416-Pelagomonas_calceolata.AAC.2